MRKWAIPGVIVLLTGLITVIIGRGNQADAKADANPGPRDVIVHLFRPEVRSFYNLERMWAFGDSAAGAA